MGGRVKDHSVGVSGLSVVADASALIALHDIRLLDRLAPLFIACIIPPAVSQEIAPTVSCPSRDRLPF